MSKFFQSIGNSVTAFARDEDGAQVVEYALIIALVSNGLALALSGATSADGLRGAFASLVTRVGNCISGTGTC